MFRKIMIFTLAAVMLFTAGCAKNDVSQTTASGGTQTTAPTSEGFDLSGCRIVNSISQPSALRQAAINLQTYISKNSGIKPEIVADSTGSDDSAVEIIIGETTRTQSAEAMNLLASAGYAGGAVIAKIGNKLVVNGSSNETTVIAVKRLMNNGILNCGDGKVSCDVGSGIVFDLSGEIISAPGSRFFRTETKTVVYQPTKKNPNVTLTYPRVVVLEHNGESNGQILVTGESLDEEAYIIHRSTDGGKTFEILSRIKADRSGMVANWQPFIYELPCAVGGLPEGTLLFSGCVRDRSTSSRTEIAVWKSTDLGASWQTLSTVVTAGGIDGGVWEPFLYAENGKLYCFYSDDADPVCSQTIVLKVSEDGINWGDQIQVTACADANLRPGMASVTKMGNGEYFITYEMVGMGGNIVHYKKTKNLTDWGNVKENGTVLSAGGVSIGSAPYCAWTSAGGENGTLIVTAHNRAGGSSSTGTEWLISYDYGRSFKSIRNPLPYTLGDKHRYAYSPGLFVAGDGSIYYVNDINCEEKRFKDKASITLAHIIIE